MGFPVTEIIFKLFFPVGRKILLYKTYSDASEHFLTYLLGTKGHHEKSAGSGELAHCKDQM